MEWKGKELLLVTKAFVNRTRLLFIKRRKPQAYSIKLSFTNMSVENRPQPPPPYEETDSITNPPNGPFIPDDFKYTVRVSSCEPQVREFFMNRVYSILSAQLLLTSSFTYWATQSPTLQSFIQNHIGIWILSTISALILCFFLAFTPRKDDYISENIETGPSNSLREPSTPWYVLSKRSQLFVLGLFTIAEAYSISIVALTYDEKTILSALFITTIVVIGVSLTAMSGKFEFALESATSIYYWLNWALWIMIGMGFTMIFFGMNSTMDLIYGWFGAILFTVYLFVDTQLIFRKVFPDEEVKCAMMLYLDIINLFLSILRILGNSSSDD
ncbi:Bxi1p NDAI_0A06200 [Naumovozyma dairenensis CBS 421]|uniref:Uncharacterized protein n=1 Tax=Naumovozyma dairenensis (strain ATCC 10597 / BCRC 20456 / CBS 421 / NBRC 0211 / NRRL Y-12639) TaxID=1071378 RepID=G0W4N6_NAUDC|nr:hypothetical protein NDAI_0A06200 [Naumovozyma dairenensis CBS 421]CCD22774.1 hypothetical protein NDAI_0A06200 [Naumovozyma dairenensis CBS 421]